MVWIPFFLNKCKNIKSVFHWVILVWWSETKQIKQKKTKKKTKKSKRGKILFHSTVNIGWSHGTIIIIAKTQKQQWWYMKSMVMSSFLFVCLCNMYIKIRISWYVDFIVVWLEVQPQWHGEEFSRLTALSGDISVALPYQVEQTSFIF